MRNPPSAVFRLWPWAAAALSGLLLTLCFPPWNLGWLCWIALTPLICSVWFSRGRARREGRRKALLGYVAGIVFFATVFSWLATLGTLFQQPWLHGLPVLLSLYLALYFAFWAWFIGALVNPGVAPNLAQLESKPAESRAATRINVARTGSALSANPELSAFLSSRRNLLTAFFGASAWVTHEWVRGWLFSGFNWNSIGVALHDQLALIQIADITGVSGLSFLVAFCNLMVVMVVRRIVAEIGPVFFKRIRWEFSFTVVLVVAVFAYGVRTLMRAHTPQGDTVRIAAIQPNIAQIEKFSAEFEDRIFDRLGSLTALAASTHPDLIVWPEAAMPRGMFADQINYRFIRDQAARGSFAFLIGTVDFDPEQREEFNVAALLTNRGETIQPYRKIHLVPFGEYMPLRHSFPLFAMVAGDLVPGDFSAGTEFTVMDLPQPAVRLSALICFEDTVGNLTRQFVQNGAQLLINLTNDGWFLTSAAAEQHAANAVFRAVENRRPLLRCTNTGVTCAVDWYGRVDRWLPPFQRGFVTREIMVPRANGFTFYTRHGDWFAAIAALATVLRLAGRLFRRTVT